MRLKFLSVFSLFILVSCSSLEKKKVYGYVSKSFLANYDFVWNASLLAMKNYPIKSSDADLRLIETKWIKGANVWVSKQIVGDPKKAGLRYRVRVKLTKGKIGKREAIKVSVLKEFYQQKNFFEKLERVPTDGIEEDLILYRISKELNIEESVRKKVGAN